MSKLLPFRRLKNRPDVYRGNDWIKKFCESLREHEMEIINPKNKEMKLLTKQQQVIKIIDLTMIIILS